MSEKSEKLVKIILPDLLNYLEMVERGEIIERRFEKNFPREQKEEDFADSKISTSSKKRFYNTKRREEI